MFFVNDLSVIFILKMFIAVLLFNLCSHSLHKLILDRFLAKDIVRSHTSLTTVEILSEHDAPCR